MGLSRRKWIFRYYSHKICGKLKYCKVMEKWDFERQTYDIVPESNVGSDRDLGNMEEKRSGG